MESNNTQTKKTGIHNTDEKSTHSHSKLKKFYTLFKNKKVSSKFDKKSDRKKNIMQLLTEMNYKLSYESTPRKLFLNILYFDIALLVLLSLALIIVCLFLGTFFSQFLIFFIAIWTLLFAAVYLISMLVVFLYFDFKMHQYTKQIEENLPDFLQLASANINAGMTVDRALWFAVRPKFGILAKEMENAAKATSTGEDIEKTLLAFSDKYDSRVLKETINLIIAGISSGGEMSQLLNKISINIKETELMKKEISASVTTYVIFIGAASIIIAPILFALSTELLLIIGKIMGSVHLDPGGPASNFATFNFSSDSISISDFKAFAIVMLVISSFFSACIISVIRKGNIQDGIKNIPLFIAVSIVIYLLAAFVLHSALGGLF